MRNDFSSRAQTRANNTSTLPSHDFPCGGVRTPKMRSLFAAIALAICANRPLHTQAFLRLSATDSVRVVGTELVHVPGQRPGLLIDYAATDGLADTASLRQRAIAIFRAEKPHLDSLRLVNFIVRAVDKASDSTSTLFHRKVYGFVFQLRTDGNWYFLNDSTHVVLAADSTSRR